MYGWNQTKMLRVPSIAYFLWDIILHFFNYKPLFAFFDQILYLFPACSIFFHLLVELLFKPLSNHHIFRVSRCVFASVFCCKVTNFCQCNNSSCSFLVCTCPCCHLFLSLASFEWWCSMHASDSLESRTFKKTWIGMLWMMRETCWCHDCHVSRHPAEKECF